MKVLRRGIFGLAVQRRGPDDNAPVAVGGILTAESDIQSSKVEARYVNCTGGVMVETIALERRLQLVVAVGNDSACIDSPFIDPALKQALRILSDGFRTFCKNGRAFKLHAQQRPNLRVPSPQHEAGGGGPPSRRSTLTFRSFMHRVECRTPRTSCAQVILP